MGGPQQNQRERNYHKAALLLKHFHNASTIIPRATLAQSIEEGTSQDVTGTHKREEASDRLSVSETVPQLLEKGPHVCQALLRRSALAQLLHEGAANDDPLRSPSFDQLCLVAPAHSEPNRDRLVGGSLEVREKILHVVRDGGPRSGD